MPIIIKAFYMNYLFDYLQQLIETGDVILVLQKKKKIHTVISQIKIRS